MLWHRLIRDRAEMMCQGLTQPPVRLHLAAKFWIGGDSTLHMRMDLRVQLSVRKGHQHLVSDLPAASPSPPSSALRPRTSRSEEHTSELQSLMRISYAVFCLQQKTQYINI